MPRPIPIFAPVVSPFPFFSVQDDVGVGVAMEGVKIPEGIMEPEIPDGFAVGLAVARYDATTALSSGLLKLRVGCTGKLSMSVVCQAIVMAL